MAQFEELRITVNLVDNASAQLGALRAQLASLESLSRQSATGLQSLATSLTNTGTAATAATKGIQGVTQQTNAAIRATAGLTKEMAGLRQASTQLEQGFRSLGSAARGLQALPQIGVGIVSLTQGVSGLGAALDKIGPAAKVAGMAIGGVAIAALTGAAAFVAWNVSVFRFARETRALSDSAKMVGVSFADLKNATVNAQRFGIASETMIQSYAGIQKAMTDLSRNDSSLRQDLLSKGLDPAFLQSIEQEQEGWERINLVREKALEIQAEQLRQGKSQTAAAGIAGEFAERFGVNRTVLTRPAMQAPTEEQKAVWAKYEASSTRIMTIWDRVYSKVDALKGKVLGMGLDSLERLMRWIEQHWEEIDKFVTDTAKEILGMAPKWETIKSSVETIVNLLRGEFFEPGTIGAALFGKEIQTPEQREALKKTNEERAKRGEAPLTKQPGAAELWGAGTEVRRGIRAGEHHRGAVVGDPMGGLFFGGGGNLGQPTPGTSGAPNFDDAAALKELSDLSNWGSGGPVKIPGSPGTGGWADVPQSENVIDLRKRDDHGELIEENTSVLANTNDQLKQLNDYLQDEAAKRRGRTAGAGGDQPATFDERFGGGGGTPQSAVGGGPSGGGGAGPSGGGGVPSSSPPGTGPSASAPMGPRGGPSNVPNVAAPHGPSPPPGAPPTGGDASGGLAADRAKFKAELDADPALRDKVLRIAANEQGKHGLGTQAVIESMMNRASHRGRTLAQEARWTGEGGYYAQGNMGRGALENQQHKAILEKSLSDVLGGSNITDYATDNASQGLAAKRTRNKEMEFIREINGESFYRPGRVSGAGNVRTHAGWMANIRGAQETQTAAATPNAGPSTVDIDPIAGAQPMPGAEVRSGMGMRNHPIHKVPKFHAGTDTRGKAGAPFSPRFDGKVTAINAHGDVTVKNANGSESVYRHVNPQKGMKVGDSVQAGVPIGVIAQKDSRSTGPHLHEELRDKNGKLIDTAALDRDAQERRYARAQERERTATAAVTSPGGRGALDQGYAQAMRAREPTKGDTFASRFTGGDDDIRVGLLPPERKDTFSDRFAGDELDRGRTEIDRSNSGGPTKGQLNLRIGNMPRGTQWATEGDLFKNSKTEAQSAMVATPSGGWEE